MTPPISTNLIERHSATWDYTMDLSRAPEFVLVTAHGEADKEMLDTYVADLSDAMDRIVGVGRRFCPLIIDAREIHPGRMTLPEVAAVGASFLRRHDRLVIIRDTLLSDAKVMDMLIQMLGALLPKLKLTDSVDDAFAAIRG